MPDPNYQIFNQPQTMPVGWYWLIESHKLKKAGKPYCVNILDQDFVVYRGADGQANCLEAYCPHMGANLSDGTVKHNNIRCAFHHWEFDPQGQCHKIPCLQAPPEIKLCNWHTTEAHGLVWIWLGSDIPEDQVPGVELLGEAFEHCFGHDMQKNLHPTAIMVNGIDEQHFNHLHGLKMNLQFESRSLSPYSIQFHNIASLPRQGWIYRLINMFYKDKFTFELVYWYGHTVLLRFGPDFCHLRIMFTFRQDRSGKAIGKTIYFASKKSYPLNWLLYSICYIIDVFLEQEDSLVLHNAKFDIKHLLPQDRSIKHYIDHLEQQQTIKL